MPVVLKKVLSHRHAIRGKRLSSNNLRRSQRLKRVPDHRPFTRGRVLFAIHELESSLVGKSVPAAYLKIAECIHEQFGDYPPEGEELAIGGQPPVGTARAGISIAQWVDNLDTDKGLESLRRRLYEWRKARFPTLTNSLHLDAAILVTSLDALRLLWIVAAHRSRVPGTCERRRLVQCGQKICSLKSDAAEEMVRRLVSHEYLLESAGTYVGANGLWVAHGPRSQHEAHYLNLLARKYEPVSRQMMKLDWIDAQIIQHHEDSTED